MEHFRDKSSFMIKNGRVAYQTEKRTWLEVFKNDLFLDDVFFYQTHLPYIRFDFKPSSYRCKKEKEGLNDEDRCESCKEPFDTITFQTKNDSCKEAVCSSCAYPSRMERIDRSAYLMDINNHVNKVETLLNRLSYIPGDYRVSVRWILPLLEKVMWKWTIYTGLYEINTLRMISNSWSRDDLSVINIIEVIKILREIRDKLLDVIN